MNLKREISIKKKNEILNNIEKKLDNIDKKEIKPNQYYDIYKNDDEYVESNLKKSLIEMVSTRKKKK